GSSDVCSSNLTAATASPTRRPVPAAAAAGANAENTPAPTIDASPTTTASGVPSRRAREGWSAVEVTRTACQHGRRRGAPGRARSGPGGEWREVLPIVGGGRGAAGGTGSRRSPRPVHL